MDLRLPARGARRALPVCLLIALSGAVALARQPQDASDALPPPQTEYMGRKIAPTMGFGGAVWLTRPTREEEEHTARMLAALELQPGDTVCDFGCGVGALSLPLAERVGAQGQVLAVDIQPEMLAGLEERAADAGVTNVRTVLAGPADPKLAPASCDLVLMVDVYHELGYPERVLAAVRRALKPGGRLVLVEFRAEDPGLPIRPEHEMSREQVERELAANGFRLASSFEELPMQHLLAFVPTASVQDPGGEDGGFFDQFDDEPHDGAWLYERNCSGCHGPTGAGDGKTARELGVQPRNFNQGGFSFGNTREAIFRTVTSGIPGRSVMPSFAGTLSEEERWLVVDHVRTLMPPQDEEDASASVMVVGARPAVARGKLPPVEDGLPEHPRGLLIGLPAGLTFEYDTQDVRLLAVRMGPFADREDWRDRGGGYLRPLGQTIYRPGADDAPTIVLGTPQGDRPLRATLASTTAMPGRASLSYALRADADAAPLVTVMESCGFVPTSAGAAFQRRFQVPGPSTSSGRARLPLRFRVAGSASARFERVVESSEGRPARWVIGQRDDGLFECVRVEPAQGVSLIGDDGVRLRNTAAEPIFSTSGLWVGVQVGADEVAGFEVTVLLAPTATDEDLARWSQEIAR